MPPLSAIVFLRVSNRLRVGVDQVTMTCTSFRPRNSLDVGVAAAVDAGDADADGVVGAEHPAGRLGAGDGEERDVAAAAAAVLRKPRREMFFMTILRER